MSKPASNLLIRPEEFFRTQVHSASQNLKISLGDNLEFYIVNLLCEFINPNKLNENLGEVDVLDTPLAMLLQKAVDTELHDEKIRLLKTLGDISLYVSGYFQDYFNRKTFDISYYITMGASAYDRAASLTKSRNNQAGVFVDLSENFHKLVDLVAEVAAASNPDTNQNILAIYDRWNRCNSQRLRRILESLGIEPIPVPIKYAQ